MARITFEGNFCDISMCRENPCPYNGMCSQRQTWERPKEYEDTGLEPEEIADFMKRWEQTVEIGGMLKKYCIDHIRDLLQAEQDGRLVVLPSKTVWELTMDAGPDCDMKCPVDAWDESLGCDLCSKAKQFAYERPCTQDLLKELGKTVFLNREEAEAALDGKGGAPSDAPEELVEAEWKNRLMRTVKEKQNGV